MHCTVQYSDIACRAERVSHLYNVAFYALQSIISSALIQARAWEGCWWFIISLCVRLHAARQKGIVRGHEPRGVVSGAVHSMEDFAQKLHNR
jgi:hypothetical protein